MSSPFSDQIEQAQAEFERYKVALASAKRDLEATRTTVTGAKRAVTVTVDSYGKLLDITFPTKSYRSMPPAELSKLLVDTIDKARSQAVAATADALGGLAPPGAPVIADLFGGPVDFDSMLHSAMEAPTEAWRGLGGADHIEESAR